MLWSSDGYNLVDLNDLYLENKGDAIRLMDNFPMPSTETNIKDYMKMSLKSLRTLEETVAPV